MIRACNCIGSIVKANFIWKIGFFLLNWEAEKSGYQSTTFLQQIYTKNIHIFCQQTYLKKTAHGLIFFKKKISNTALFCNETENQRKNSKNIQNKHLFAI